MARKVRSARGIEVDFDALNIKKQLATNPIPVEVQAREEFVDNKNRRKNRRKLQKVKEELDEKSKLGEVMIDDKDSTKVDDTVKVDDTTDEVSRKQKIKKKD
jgi:hypothetical protein